MSAIHVHLRFDREADPGLREYVQTLPSERLDPNVEPFRRYASDLEYLAKVNVPFEIAGLKYDSGDWIGVDPDGYFYGVRDEAMGRRQLVDVPLRAGDGEVSERRAVKKIETGPR